MKLISVRHGSEKVLTHKARQVIISPWKIIENGHISVLNDIIVDISSGKPSFNTRIIDHGEGILMPALVNSHVHFELSALKKKVPFDKGFNGWVRELLREREQCSIDMLCKEARKAMDIAAATGTLLAGEISTLGITKDLFENSDIGGVWFHEYLGREEYCKLSPLINSSYSKTVCPDMSITQEMSIAQEIATTQEIVTTKENVMTKNIVTGKDILPTKMFSIAGHAPHTTSPELLKKLKYESKSANLPFSIHVAESCDEMEFICSGKGNWSLFLKERSIDFSSWPIPSRSPVQYLKDLDLLDHLTIAVHLLNIDNEDIEIILKTDTKPVFCPRSNFNIHKNLPDIPLFRFQCPTEIYT
ncbi:MAG: amidohydrolase family protein [Desulfamplus sp.]|nr:amidohydrolase family protein [Desulfamplus sp.]